MMSQNRRVSGRRLGLRFLAELTPRLLGIVLELSIDYADALAFEAFRIL